jgi:CRP-like cAMP-binding protein
VPVVELSLSDQDAIVDTSLGDWSTEIRTALAQTPLLSALPAPALERLVDRAKVVALAANEVLFREGDPGHTLYIVVDGEVTAITERPTQTELARLGASSFFGEIALLTEQPRSATIRAEAACELLAIDRDAIGEVVQAYPEALPVFLRFVRDRLVDRLVRTSPLFAGLPEADRGPLAARFSFLEIEPGTTIVAEGARAAGLYVLLSGRAEVRRDGQPVATLGPGDLCGHTTLIGGKVAPASVHSTAKCLALVLPQQDFSEVIMTHPQVLEYVGEEADKRRKLIQDAHIDLL